MRPKVSSQAGRARVWQEGHPGCMGCKLVLGLLGTVYQEVVSAPKQENFRQSCLVGMANPRPRGCLRGHRGSALLWGAQSGGR